jgi:hypothetical protein
VAPARVFDEYLSSYVATSSARAAPPFVF